MIQQMMMTWISMKWQRHYSDVIMGAIASQITSLTIVYSSVYSGADQRKHQSSASLAFVRGIHRRPVNYPHKGPVTRKMFPFDDVLMVKPFSRKKRMVYLFMVMFLLIYNRESFISGHASKEYSLMNNCSESGYLVLPEGWWRIMDVHG